MFFLFHPFPPISVDCPIGKRARFATRPLFCVFPSGSKECVSQHGDMVANAIMLSIFLFRGAGCDWGHKYLVTRGRQIGTSILRRCPGLDTASGSDVLAQAEVLI